MCVVFCSPSAETIHQELGAHYTLKDAQKENENSVSKILYAVSQRIVINALRFAARMLRRRKTLRQMPSFSGNSPLPRCNYLLPKISVIPPSAPQAVYH